MYVACPNLKPTNTLDTLSYLLGKRKLKRNERLNSIFVADLALYWRRLFFFSSLRVHRASEVIKCKRVHVPLLLLFISIDTLKKIVDTNCALRAVSPILGDPCFDLHTRILLTFPPVQTTKKKSRGIFFRCHHQYCKIFWSISFLLSSS